MFIHNLCSGVHGQAHPQFWAHLHAASLPWWHLHDVPLQQCSLPNQQCLSIVQQLRWVCLFTGSCSTSPSVTTPLVHWWPSVSQCRGRTLVKFSRSAISKASWMTFCKLAQFTFSFNSFRSSSCKTVQQPSTSDTSPWCYKTHQWTGHIAFHSQCMSPPLVIFQNPCLQASP